MYNKNKNSTKNRKIVLVVMGVMILVSASALLGFALKNDDSKQDQTIETVTPELTDGINLQPPTEQEKTAGDKQKEEIVDQPEAQLPNEANVVIVDAAQYDNEIEVRAFVNNVVANGSCTITFQKDSESFVKKVDAFADASSSLCTNLTLSREEFSTAGTWQITVLYENGSIQGSASKAVEIK